MDINKSAQVYLSGYGIKPSVQRLAIMDYLIANRVHPAVDDIYNALSVSIPTLSRTTVYNTLKLFAEQGAVQVLGIDDTNVRFDIDTTNHAHFKCLDCGCVYDVPVKNIEAIILEGIGELKITETHLYYKGYCRQCREKSEKRCYQNNDSNLLNYLFMATKKFICTVCGYVHEGEEAPEFCPQCKVPRAKFKELVETEGALTFVDEHVIGVAKGVDEEVLSGLKAHFNGECTEVGMYLAMSRQADREGYPEVAEAFKRYAWEEAEHAAKFAELLGECVWDTKTNLKKRMEAEAGACEDKKRIATLAKKLNLDAIHDTVHEMCKDEARHGKGFEGLYNRYFKK